MRPQQIYSNLQNILEIQKSIKEKELKKGRTGQKACYDKCTYHKNHAKAARKLASLDIEMAALQEKTALAHLNAAHEFSRRAVEYDMYINQVVLELRDILKREIGLNSLKETAKKISNREEEEQIQEALGELENLKNMMRTM